MLQTRTLCSIRYNILLTYRPARKSVERQHDCGSAEDRTGMSDEIVEIVNPDGPSPVLLVCEHASAAIPDEFDGLGLTATDRLSHAVWDPGAQAVAAHLSKLLDARLVSSRVSRLVYDANRPPDAFDAIPARSERIEVPGNRALSDADRAARTARFYEPFRAALAAEVARRPDPVIFTVHSFTPVYEGVPRAVEIGVLHDEDSRLADALLASADRLGWQVARNEPYGPQHGVTHTLKVHALPHGHRNAMLEMRNDLIADEPAQRAMAQALAAWIGRTLAAEGLA